MLNGRAAIETMAEIYPRLYLVPGQDGAESAYLNAVRRGIAPEKNNLSHYITDEKDELDTVNTPVGPIKVLTLCKRPDFETFLRCMAKRCTLAEIPKMQGAAILDGIVNWNKIFDHKRRFFEEHNTEKTDLEENKSDWSEEFRKFTSDKKNYTDAMIVISVGPYSGIPGSSVGKTEEEWLELSHTIRYFHECTHFIMRRTYPGMIDAVWDELVADAIGLYGAFGKFDPNLEKMFLGIHEGHYTGGRLTIYVDNPKDTEELDRLSLHASKVLDTFECILENENEEYAFNLIPKLQKYKKSLWDDPKSA